MAFGHMTTSQRATIDNLHSMKLALHFAGIDRNDRPVVWIKDVRREFFMAVQPDGSGRDPFLPLRELSEEEVLAMPVADAECLFSLPTMQINPTTKESA